MMLLDANTPTAFLLCILIFFGAILVRYFMAVGIFYYYFYIAQAAKLEEIRLSKRALRKFKKEINWSIKSSTIFAVVGAITYWLWQNDLTAIYLDASVYGYWYLPVSLGTVLLHETYCYWIHRWMHHPKVFRRAHKVHHDSLSPTSWTAFPFHPRECALDAVIYRLS